MGAPGRMIGSVQITLDEASQMTALAVVSVSTPFCRLLHLFPHRFKVPASIRSTPTETQSMSENALSAWPALA